MGLSGLDDLALYWRIDIEGLLMYRIILGGQDQTHNPLVTKHYPNKNMHLALSWFYQVEHVTSANYMVVEYV